MLYIRSSQLIKNSLAEVLQMNIMNLGEKK